MFICIFILATSHFIDGDEKDERDEADGVVTRVAVESCAGWLLPAVVADMTVSK